jgi:hypothetical protein
VLSFEGMHHSTETRAPAADNLGDSQVEHEPLADSEPLPLKLTSELWAGLNPAQRSVYRRADALLEELGPTRQASIGELISTGPGGEVLRALEVLEGMDLIQVEPTGRGPLIKLIALPSDHIAIIGPDGRQRWVFIAQPLDPPDVDPSKLN